MFSRFLLGVFFLSISLPSVFADTVNFDGINASSGDVSLGGINPYQGFVWTNFSAYTTTPGFDGFNNGIVSGPNAAYSGGDILGTPIVGQIAASSPFNFVSGYLGSGYYDDLDVTVDGFLNGSLLFSRTVLVNTQGAQFFNFGFADVNELDFFGSRIGSTTDPFGCGQTGCTLFTLDDATFAPATSTPPPPPPPVPEPSVAVLLALGLFALSTIRHHKLRVS